MSTKPAPRAVGAKRRSTNLLPLGLLVAVVVLSLSPAAGAAVLNIVEYGASVIQPESASRADRRESADAVTAGSGLLQSTVGASTGSVIAFASAAPGHIGVSVVGTADVTGPGPGAVVAANATASWSENLMLFGPHLPHGAVMTATGFLFFDGDLSAFAGPFGAAHVTAVAAGQSFSVKTANVSGGPIDEQPPKKFFLSIEFGNGLEHIVGGSLSISGLAQTGSGHADFVGNYRNSLHWGGINSVTNALTGEIIDDWTITSESGADYAHPIGFPDGDTDFDEDVDLEDLNNVRNNFGEAGRSVLGDTSPYDGVVDLFDLNAVRNNFGTSPNPVPEPSSLALLAVAIVGAALRVRRASCTDH